MARTTKVSELHETETAKQEVLNLSSNNRKTKYKFRFSLLSEYQKLEKREQIKVKLFVETLFFRRFRVLYLDRIFLWTKLLCCLRNQFSDPQVPTSNAYFSF